MKERSFDGIAKIELNENALEKRMLQMENQKLTQCVMVT